MTQPNRQEWLQARRSGIGGSDAAAIVGLSPYRTALDIYHEKVGAVADDEQTPSQKRGLLLEDVVVQAYTALTGKQVRRQAQRTHGSFPFIIANIDRQIFANGDPRGTGLLEVKCPSIRPFLRYQREGLPDHMVVQGQHYLGVTGYAWMAFAIFNADLWKLVHFEIERDDKFIAALFEKEIAFWQNHVEKRVPPEILTAVLAPPSNMPDVAGAIPQREDPEWAAAVESYNQAVTLAETAEQVHVAAKARLQELLGAYGVAEGADLRVYWREMAGRKSFDRKALEGARPLDTMKVAEVLIKWEHGSGLVHAPMSELIADLKEATLDLSAFDKQGKPYPEFRAYRLKPESGEDE